MSTGGAGRAADQPSTDHCSSQANHGAGGEPRNSCLTVTGGQAGRIAGGGG